MTTDNSSSHFNFRNENYTDLILQKSKIMSAFLTKIVHRDAP